ncbi:hypothetical protein D1007_03729 [Hordeum vulgare]|nr:hypothetical protein D1007_03729 [Hordeum vulgare]
MKARQFVNVVMQKYGRSSTFYTMSRIKAGEQLFYGSTAEARAAARSPRKKKFAMALPSSAVVPAWMEIMSRMPPAMLRFEISRSDGTKLDFLPFYQRGGGGASKILCVDAAGRCFIHDIDAGVSETVPSLNTPKGDNNPICPSPDALDPERADALYVMNQVPVSRNPSNFEVLKYSDPSSCDKMEGCLELAPAPTTDGLC